MGLTELNLLFFFFITHYLQTGERLNTIDSPALLLTTLLSYLQTPVLTSLLPTRWKPQFSTQSEKANIGVSGSSAMRSCCAAESLPPGCWQRCQSGTGAEGVGPANGNKSRCHASCCLVLFCPPTLSSPVSTFTTASFIGLTLFCKVYSLPHGCSCTALCTMKYPYTVVGIETFPVWLL